MPPEPVARTVVLARVGGVQDNPFGLSPCPLWLEPGDQRHALRVAGKIRRRDVPIRAWQPDRLASRDRFFQQPAAICRYFPGIANIDIKTCGGGE